MNNKQINERVYSFIKNRRTTYSLMIDGEWGSGKTYYIQNILIPYINKKEETNKKTVGNYKSKNVIYISLYGYKSCDEILKNLWLQTMPISEDNIKKSKKYGYASNITRAVIGGGLSFFNIELPKIDYEKITDLHDHVLIFDDIERCNIEINELFGFLNNFVEHDNLKIILVGNQKELKLNHNQIDLGIRYLLSLDERLIFPEKSNRNMDIGEVMNNIVNNRNKKESVDTRIEISEMRRRYGEIFGGQSDYDRIKEKLIGVTIQYKADIDVDIETLIDLYLGVESAKSVLYAISDEVIAIMKKYEHENYRTLLFAFEKFDELCKFIYEQPSIMNEELIEKFLRDVFIYTLELSIKHKIGGFIATWSGGQEYGQVKTSDSKYNYDTVLGFKFVYDFVLYSLLDLEKISNVMDYYNKEKNKKDIQYEILVVNLRNEWINLTDEEVYHRCLEIDELINDKKLNLNLLLEILSLRLELNEIGFDFDIDDLVKRIRTSIVDFDNDRLEHERYRINWSEEIRDKYIEYRDLILTDVEKITKKKKAEFLNSLISNSNDIHKFINYAHQNKDVFRIEGKFLSVIDYDSIVKSIIHSNSMTISTFRKILYEVYGTLSIKEYYVDDITQIIDLISYLELYIDKEKNNLDNINRLNLVELLNDLKQYGES